MVEIPLHGVLLRSSPVTEQVYLEVSVPLHLAVSLPVPLRLLLQTLICPRLCIFHLLLQFMHPGMQTKTVCEKQHYMHCKHVMINIEAINLERLG